MADLDLYCFTAASNDVISFTLVRTNGSGNPTLRIFDPLGTVIYAACGDGVRVYEYDVRLVKTGTYTAEVTDCNAFTTTFDYLLRVSKAVCGTNEHDVGDAPEALVFGRAAGGHIDVADLDLYCFTAASNDVVSFALVRTNGSGNPTMRIFDPLGTAIYGACGDGVRVYEYDVRLTKTGTYTVEVTDCNAFTTTFDYNFCMIKIPGPNFQEPGEGSELLLSGETRTAQISAGDLDAYSFSVIGGDSVWITLSQTSGSGQAYMYLYDPSGNVVGTATSTTQARLRIPCATNTGYYTISVLDSALSRSLTYNLTLLQDPGPPPSYDPEHPYLAIFRCMTNTVVRWPTNAAGFQLEYRTNAVSGGWSNVPPPYPVFANHHYVTNQSAAPMRFYRLNRPAP